MQEKVLWSDDIIIYHFGLGIKHYFQCKCKAVYHSENTIVTVRHGGGSIIRMRFLWVRTRILVRQECKKVWSQIQGNTRRKSVPVCKRLEILMEVHLPTGQWPWAYCQSYIKVVQSKNLNVLECPSQSPDLNLLRTNGLQPICQSLHNFANENGQKYQYPNVKADGDISQTYPVTCGCNYSRRWLFTQGVNNMHAINKCPLTLFN